MSYTLAEVAALQVNGALKGHVGFLNRLAQVDNPGLGMAGKVTVQALTGATAEDCGTASTENFANTVTELTRANKRVMKLINPGELMAPDFGPMRLKALAIDATDALVKKAQEAVLDALYAAQAGSSVVAYTDNLDSTSEAGARANLEQLDEALMYLVARNAGSFKDITIAMHPTAFGNLLGITSFLPNTPLIANASVDVATYRGVPIFPIAHTTGTNWGADDKPISYVIHKNAVGFVWVAASVADNGDGTGIVFNPQTSQYTMTFLGTYATGVINTDLFTEIDNTGSDTPA